MKIWRAIMLLPGLLLCGAGAQAYDPGIPDTVWYSADSLMLNRSMPITVSIVNDETIIGFDLGVVLGDLTGGFARYDSLIWMGRMGDPRVLPDRPFPRCCFHLNAPDTFGIVAMHSPASLVLEPGRGAIAQLWVTGVTVGSMRVAPCDYPPSDRNIIVVSVGPALQSDFLPPIAEVSIPVVAGSALPVLSGTDVVRGLVGATLGGAITANSPTGLSLTLQLVDFLHVDDDLRTPQAQPSVSGGNPLSFTWTPTAADIGIWEAVFRACDTEGGCAEHRVNIQVVSASAALVPFTVSNTPANVNVQWMEKGDLDNDGVAEIVLGGDQYSAHPALVQVFDADETGMFHLDYDLSDVMSFFFAPQLGFFDGDDQMDLMVSKHFTGTDSVLVRPGLGDNAFVEVGFSTPAQNSKASTLIDFNHDQYLDYVTAAADIQVMGGGYPVLFSEVYRHPDAGLCINGADFNGDGYDDIAVGTATGLKVYLNDQGMAFTLVASYPQTYEATSIDITNEGSDFNNDDVFDLCLTTPSQAGQYSEIMAYIGQGDGTFDQELLRTVRGQTLANRIGDINGDGYLDIVYVNATTRWVGILFGDGAGGFADEIRLKDTYSNPTRVQLSDIDLDGDLDILVASFVFVGYSNLVTFRNETNPGGMMRADFRLEARDNAELSMTSATGKVLNRLANTMSAGSYTRRNIDGNANIDAVAAIGVVEPGAYDISITPKPGAGRDGTFSLNYTLNGSLYRLAKDQVIASGGYTFSIFPSGGSSVAPLPGAFLHSSAPSFIWQAGGSSSLEVAYDPAFTNVIYAGEVASEIFTLPIALEILDTTAVYWRVKPVGQTDWDNLYVVNLVPGLDGTCGDATGDGTVNISDLTYLVNYLFRTGPSPVNPALADVDGSGNVDIADLTSLVRFLFRGNVILPCGS